MAHRGRADAAGILSEFPGARIVFQTIVSLRDWRVVGFEALARFDDGAPPPHHLDRAEAMGIREELELLLIEQAIAAMDELPAGMSVTFNASGITVLRPELSEMLQGLTRPWGLEIYEAATTADLAAVRERVTSLGGSLLVDDAGAVCADEGRITTLRPDIVKIDRSLFWQVTEDPDARTRLEALLTASRATGATVLVEGVSDAAQVELARALGSDYAQGFHLGIPAPASEIPELLAELHRSIGVDAPGL